MNGPEKEGNNQEEDIDREQQIALSLTRRQIDTLLVAIHDDLVDSKRHLEEMRADMATDATHADDYNIVVRHVNDLEALQELLLTRPAN